VLGVAASALFLLNSGLAVEVDEAGFFASAEHVAKGDVFPGVGVRVVAVDGAGRVVGRLERGANGASIWTRAADGSLAPRPMRTHVRPGGSLRAGAVAAFVAHLPRTPTSAAFAESAGATIDGVERPSAPEGDAPAPWSSRTPATAATQAMPLDEWAPQECLFVRFRSVEAAYRFADAADRLAGALLVSETEDARDYGTLRLVLHDLLLPTIWRTNPDATRGVGELALVVAPPFVRGRLKAALILRVVDPDLHRMQTEAGVAEESSEDHLWRPADDPFPAERARLNTRITVAGVPDVEIVATDRELAERIAARKSAPVARRAEYAEARAASLDPEGRPVAEEAAFAFHAAPADADWRALLPGLLRTDARALRESAGVRRLAEKAFGAADLAGRLDERASGPSALAAFAAVRVTTDARGASIWARCIDADAARRFVGALRGLASAGASADRACARNLADLVPLAVVENPQEDVAERSFVVLGWKPVCPCGGTYAVHPVTRETSCSVHGTARAPKSGAWKPPAVSDVAADGADLTFRLAIDWSRRE
jgi:hypothetical protein